MHTVDVVRLWQCRQRLLPPPLPPRPQVGGPPYTELGAFGGDREVIDSDYFFPLIDGGRDIRIQHVRNGLGGFDSVITITASTDVDANVDGDGKIDVLTNGFVHIVEWSGDLRAGEIVSTDDDVTLYSPRRILDAETGDAAADAPIRTAIPHRSTSAASTS